MSTSLRRCNRTEPRIFADFYGSKPHLKNWIGEDLCESVADLFQYDFQKKYAVMPVPTSTTNVRIHFCGIFRA